jgi:hypothetical protein
MGKPLFLQSVQSAWRVSPLNIDSPFVPNFPDDFAGGGVKVCEFDRSCLLDQSTLLETFGEEGRAVIGILLGEVTADGATFIEDEAIVVLGLLSMTDETEKTLTRTGTWPNGCIARNSGVLCPWAFISMAMCSKAICFSTRTRATIP